MKNLAVTEKNSIFAPEKINYREVMSYTTETIVINNPSKKMLDMIDKIKEHKQKLRMQMRNVEPMFVIHA